MARREKQKPSYEPAPVVPKEMLLRFQTIQEVMSGQLEVAEGARRLGMSRNHFQTLLHRAEKAVLESVTPKPAGRPATPAREVELRAELLRVQRENQALQMRSEAVEKLLGLASDWARGTIGARARRAKTAKTRTPSNDPEEPDGGLARAVWEEVCRQVSAGAMWVEAAQLIGLSVATLRRWGGRARLSLPLRQRPGPGARTLPTPEQRAQADDLVRTLDGQIGAAALSKGVAGLSRREAAKLKRQTLSRMEAERKASARRVVVSAPDVIRGFDPVFAEAAEGRRYLMPVSDAAVPKRTTVEVKERYDAEAVYEVLKKDIESHGPPLAYRMDRAKQHTHPKVMELLSSHRVLVLQGPPHYPQYYGQLERQNREHRAMLTAMGRVDTATMLERSREKIAAMDTRWPRRALGWRTAHEIWQNRSPLTEDREELHRDVQTIAEKLRQQNGGRGFPADMAERLAIEAALTKRGYLSRQGGRC
jgi:transposase